MTASRACPSCYHAAHVGLCTVRSSRGACRCDLDARAVDDARRKIEADEQRLRQAE